MRTVIPQLQLIDDHAVITKWGIVDTLLLRPDDVLVLGEPEEGDLLLLQPTGWGRLMLGRAFGNTLISEPFGRPVSSKRWQIAGAVKAIQRPLELAAMGNKGWYVRLKDAPPLVHEHWQRLLSTPVGSIYLAELGAQLAVASHKASIVAAWETDFASELLSDVPSGVVWFSPRRIERPGPFAQLNSDQAWKAPTKRSRRREWKRRARFQELRPSISHLPRHSYAEEVILTESVPCK